MNAADDAVEVGDVDPIGNRYVRRGRCPFCSAVRSGAIRGFHRFACGTAARLRGVSDRGVVYDEAAATIGASCKGRR